MKQFTARVRAKYYLMAAADFAAKAAKSQKFVDDRADMGFCWWVYVQDLPDAYFDGDRIGRDNDDLCGGYNEAMNGPELNYVLCEQESFHCFNRVLALCMCAELCYDSAFQKVVKQQAKIASKWIT